MKKRIRLPVLCAAVFLTLASPWEACGKNVEVESETKVTFPKTDGSHEVPTELKGVIEVSLISATLPSDVEFGVNPERNFTLDDPGAQMDNPSPDKFTVTNHSAVPVRLEIASVDYLKPGDVTFASLKGDYDNGPGQAFRLVDRISEVNAYGTAILVLGEAGAAYRSGGEFEQYAICPGKVGIPVAERIEAESAAKLQIYGKVMADFYGEYQFTVRPTLKISTVRNP